MDAPSIQEADRFLKLKEVQQMFGVSRTTVWRWHAERGLKIVSIGGVTRIRESDLQAFLARHAKATSCVESPSEAHRADGPTVAV